MKRISLFLIIFFSYYTLKSQITWESFKYSEDSVFVCDNIVELKDKTLLSIEYVLHSWNTNQENSNHAYVQKRHGDSGNIFKEVIYNIDSLCTRLDRIFYNRENETYTIVGWAHKYFNGQRRGYFVVTHWDEELNLLSDTLIRLLPITENNSLIFTNGLVSHDNEYLIIGNYCENMEKPYLKNKLFFARISRSGEVIFSNWYPEIGGRNHCAIIEDIENSKYILPGLTTYYFDKDFNKLDSIITENSVDYMPTYNFNAIRFRDSLYLVTIKIKNSGGDKGLGLYTKNMKLIKYLPISKPHFFVDNLLQKKSFDFIDTSAIFMGTQFGDSGYYTLAKVNSNLRPYWIKYMSENDSIAHAVLGIEASSDGGLLVYGGKGEKVDYSYIPINAGSWILKLDENGNTVSTHDPVPGKWEITVFPNPSAGDFRIDIAGDTQDATLMLFDMQGRMMRHYEQLGQG
ncbi:MAG TPA: hypothetical protein PLU49_12220, partial [Saprospiraceae bacterium]|nr:hypothetical protein [Saprospiraceae bacterium]